MKPLAVVAIILLPFSANTWAAEEFPIELTCEVGPLIMYLNVTENPETTWYQNHSSNRHHMPHWDYEEKKERNPVRNLVINKDNIFFDKRYGMQNMHTFLNRLTGGIVMTIQNGITFSGYCTEGFKDYEENLF